MSLGKKKIQMQGSASIIPTDHFDTILYTGGGASSKSITTLDFQPDFVWIKARNTGLSHIIHDSIRGSGPLLITNSDGQEVNNGSNTVTFTSNGFNLQGGANHTSVNGAYNYVAFCFKGASSNSTNTNGSVTSTVRANPDAGFSIQSWTAGSGVDSVGHSLGVTPDLIIIKQRNGTQDWWTWSNALTGGQGLRLNRGNLIYTGDSNIFGGSSSHDSSVFYFNGTNTAQYISYTFANIDGYQKVGSFEGTGTVGTQITTGFQPRFLLYKNADRDVSWFMINSESGTNKYLYPDRSDFEETLTLVNFNSTGFTLQRTNTSGNRSGETYIYLAIA